MAENFTLDEIVFDINQFAVEYSLIFETKGEVGFGRPCVGLLGKDGHYIAFNPVEYTDGELIHPIPPDERLIPPHELVPDIYHKHDCLVVLVRQDDYEGAIRQLHAWLVYLKEQGELEICQYERYPDNIYSLFLHGPVGFAIRFKEEEGGQ